MNKEIKKTGDWMIYKDNQDRIGVYCSRCGHHVLTSKIPDVCPVCKSVNWQTERRPS